MMTPQEELDKYGDVILASGRPLGKGAREKFAHDQENLEIIGEGVVVREASYAEYVVRKPYPGVGWYFYAVVAE